MIRASDSDQDLPNSGFTREAVRTVTLIATALTLTVGLLIGTTARFLARQGVPASIEIVVSNLPESTEPPTHPVPSPAHWCGQPRPNEPLRLEAEDLAFGPDGELMRSMNGLPVVGGSEITLVTDERICERAARTLYGPESASPVLVFKVGAVYMVDDLGDRNNYWHVQLFDRTWRFLGGGYGGGA